MSLVSCASAKSLWHTRASDFEETMRVIGEKLNSVSQRLQGITDEDSLIDRQINSVYTRASVARNQAMNAQTSNNPQAANIVNNARAALNQLRQLHQQLMRRKQDIEMTKRSLHAQETSIQRQKDAVETQKKIADAAGQQFKQMEDAAIKRFFG